MVLDVAVLDRLPLLRAHRHERALDQGLDEELGRAGDGPARVVRAVLDLLVELHDALHPRERERDVGLIRVAIGILRVGVLVHLPGLHRRRVRRRRLRVLLLRARLVRLRKPEGWSD